MRLGPGAKLLRCSRPVIRHDTRWKHVVRSVRWSSSSLVGRQWSTPLAKNLAEAIETTGPISIASYMRQCLTSLEGGYYTSQTQGKDQFGQKGDFITSPEISQIFGELLGIWIVAEWMAQGKPSSGVELIEVGPGRGTLMDDMLRTLSNFKPLASSIESVYLVEASPTLRETQKRLLCGDQPLNEVENGCRSTSKYLNLPITWCEDIRFVPNEPNKTPFIVAHEFFDALPIHAFQSIPPSPNSKSKTLDPPAGPLPLTKQSSAANTNQWRELVVTPAPIPSTIITSASPSDARKDKEAKPEFQLSIAKASTPNSLVLPTLSQRYKDLLPTTNAVIEISPESHAYAADFARRIGGTAPTAQGTPPSPSDSTSRPSTTKATTKPHPTGAALILDYGPKETIPASTLRGIRNHSLVSPLSSPGRVDISADVDFTALAEAALGASEGVEVHGPVEQGYWLEQMGVKARADIICEALSGDEEGKKRIRRSMERLVERGGGGMGRIYKAIAIVPERGGRRPVGFGGGVF